MHEHQEHCNCGCGHHQEHHSLHPHGGGLTEAQTAFLHELEHHHFLPVARFLIESSREDDFSSVALAPVYLRGPEESMEWVKETGAMLLEMEEKGYLALDYDYPLEGYPYTEYRQSDLYAYFCRTIEEAKGRPGFLGDTPVLEKMSARPAEFCGPRVHFGCKVYCAHVSRRKRPTLSIAWDAFFMGNI